MTFFLHRWRIINAFTIGSVTISSVLFIFVFSPSSFAYAVNREPSLKDRSVLGTLDFSQPSPMDLALFTKCPQSPNQFKSLFMSYIMIANPVNYCSEWNAALPGTKIASGAIEIGNSLVPAVIFYPDATRKNQSKIERIFVRLVGGPGGDISPRESDKIYTDILRKGDFLVSFGYTGTLYASRFPGPDFNIACNEVSEYLKLLRQKNKLSQIILIGESLGGVIAVKSVGAGHPHYVDKLILISPLMFSPNEAIVNFNISLGYNPAGDQKINVRLLDGPVRDFNSGNYADILTFNLFKHFFPSPERSIDLPDRLTDRLSTPTLIIYGDQDRRIGLEKIPKIKDIKCVSLDRIPGMAHERDTNFFPTIAKSISYFLDERPQSSPRTQC